MDLLQALGEVVAFLEEERVPYVLIGGLAVQHWGEPRTTRDIGITVLMDEANLDRFLERALTRFRARLPDAVAFAREHRIVLLATRSGVPVDISLGIPGYEEEVMQQAMTVDLPGVGPVRLISAEDLIIHKMVAGRPRDVEDVERILIRQRLKVDLAYIRGWLAEFAPLVDGHDPQAAFEAALARAKKALSSSAQT